MKTPLISYCMVAIIIVILVMFTSIFIICAHADQIDLSSIDLSGSTQLVVAVSEQSSLRIRETPDENGEMVGSLLRGELIVPLEVCGDWVKIDKGWVNGRYLANNLDTAIGQYKVVSDASVNLRKRPKTDSKRVTYLHDGDVVMVIQWVWRGDVKWAQLDGGYVLAEYLVEDNESVN